MLYLIKIIFMKKNIIIFGSILFVSIFILSCANNSQSSQDKTKIIKDYQDSIKLVEKAKLESVDKSKAEDSNNFQVSIKIDSSTVKNLIKYFRQTQDEFSDSNKIWYEPKSAPQSTNRNGLYCYFHTEKGIPRNLRFRFQYYAESWLFFSEIQFAIDGKAYEYIPGKTERDNGDGGKIWEWCDQELSSSDKELIYALANAKSAKMKIIGKQYFDTKTVSKEQIKSIKQSLELYNALGGQF